MSSRIAGLLIVATLTSVASGCVEERPVYRHPRPVVVERRAPPPEVVEVIAPLPPPPRIVEELPPPRPGFIWARGYWHWDGRRYVGMPGHWEAVRPGYHYVHPHWEQRNDGWHLRVGVWVGD
ncbi:MAG: YXWGXW repeat-containing protein [Proteobacteria bacterium]|nr:YXWGXW repeat-containing protein [Pseudomonadota bacterium]